MLVRFSRDSSPAVRAVLLLHLPYLQFRQPKFGWDLFDNALSDATPQLWKLSERCLYYGKTDRTTACCDHALVIHANQAGTC
jgi:hypothetical protein